MTIYLFMCLNDVLGDTYYTNEEEVKELVEKANEEYGGDFWYKTLENNGMQKKRDVKAPEPVRVRGMF